MDYYYKNQLQKLEHSKIIDVKFNGQEENEHINWITLNKQSAEAIIKFLQAQFNLK